MGERAYATGHLFGRPHSVPLPLTAPNSRDFQLVRVPFATRPPMLDYPAAKLYIVSEQGARTNPGSGTTHYGKDVPLATIEAVSAPEG